MRDSEGRSSEGVVGLDIDERQPLSHDRDLDNEDMRNIKGMYHHYDHHHEVEFAPPRIGDYYSND